MKQRPGEVGTPPSKLLPEGDNHQPQSCLERAVSAALIGTHCSLVITVHQLASKIDRFGVFSKEELLIILL